MSVSAAVEASDYPAVVGYGHSQNLSMNTREKLFFPVLVSIAMILVGLAIGGCGDSSASTNTAGGNSAVKTAPDFNVKSLYGENISFSSIKGKPLVLNLAASACGPC